MTKHSPLPWRVDGTRRNIEDANGDWVFGKAPYMTDEANITHIVLAVNLFEEMRGLLERTVDKLNRQDMYEELQVEVWEFLDKLKGVDYD